MSKLTNKPTYQNVEKEPVTVLFSALNNPLVELSKDSAFFFKEKDTTYLSKKTTVKDTSCVKTCTQLTLTMESKFAPFFIKTALVFFVTISKKVYVGWKKKKNLLLFVKKGLTASLCQ